MPITHPLSELCQHALRIGFSVGKTQREMQLKEKQWQQPQRQKHYCFAPLAFENIRQ